MKNNYIKLPKYRSWYNLRRIMSYDRNVFPFRKIIGARGIGKTYSVQNMLCNFYHKVKTIPSMSYNTDDLFIWSRLTEGAVATMASDFLDSKLEKKHNIKTRIISKDKFSEIYFNDRLMGHLVALSNAPVYKGASGMWSWKRYKYFVLDEFQRERSERRTFNIVYNLRSVIESMTRISTRILEGLDLPIIIAMGNTVDEAVDLLYAFDFVPLEYGIHKLKSKGAVIEYIQDGKKYREMTKRNPLRVLNSGDDFTFGEEKLRVRDNILDFRNTGFRRYIGHLQVTEYVRFEVWQIQKDNAIYISKGLQTKKFENKVYTLHRLAANKGTVYSVKLHRMIRSNYNNNNIYFDKRLTATIFNNNMV